MATVFTLRLLWRFLVFALGYGMLLTGCALWRGNDEPTPGQKAACGRQCLANGETCSAFFAQKNAERRELFEQSKQNFWLCRKKFPNADTQAGNLCLAPAPEPELFDDCGPQLDACLEACGTTLDEVAAAAREPAPTPTPEQPAPEAE